MRIDVRAQDPALRLALLFALALFPARASGQAVGGADQARPVAGDPGISSMAEVNI